MMNEKDDHKRKSIEKCTQKKWLAKSERSNIQRYKLSWKREIFGPIVHTPKGVKQVGQKWVVVPKKNQYETDCEETLSWGRCNYFQDLYQFGNKRRTWIIWPTEKW